MQNNIFTRFDITFFWGISLICIVSLLAGIYFEQYLFFGVPALIAFVYYAFTDFRKIYFLLLFCIPLSTEVTLGSFGTDLPTEPLIVSLMFIFIIYFLLHPESVPKAFFLNPVILLLGIHYLWIFFTMLHSINMVVSIKYFLAKTWYITVFVFMTSVILNRIEAIKYFFWLVFIPLSLVMVQTVVRFAAYQFDFEFVNETMTPFFRNKVNYGAMLTSFYPFIWLANTWYKRWSITGLILKIAILVYPIAIYLSFTRMCYVALVIAAIAYFVIRLKFIKLGIATVVFTVGFSIGYFIYHNNYLRLAPDYSGRRCFEHGTCLQMDSRIQNVG
jgi:O-antigen ligase